MSYIVIFSDDELRELWRKAGGTLVGPRYRQQAAICEPRLLGFLHRFAAQIRANTSAEIAAHFSEEEAHVGHAPIQESRADDGEALIGRAGRS